MTFLRTWQWPLIMGLMSWPAVSLRLHLWRASVPVETVIFGLAIVSAAFLLTWTAEAAERDVPRTLALAGLALIAVLPEYAVDVLFAWKAGQDPSYASYATANMTGGNRLLVGVGWSMVVAIFALRTKQNVLKLASVHRTEAVSYTHLTLPTKA
jgi:cation:H+ antiporter